jgi:regulatory protein
MGENPLYKTALTKAMDLCSRREYCSDDISNKLTHWGIENSDAEKIIRVLIKENFINDLRYATAFVRDKFNYNKWGKIKIASHLKLKKIPSEIIRSALNQIDNNAYMNLLNDILTAHKRTIKAKNQYDMKAKLLRYGLSKGFESTLLYDLINEIGGTD